jgi:hypothetical protein
MKSPKISTGRSKVTLALNGGGFPEGFACHHLNPIRYIVRGGLRTNHTSCGKHARVETSRNMPGTPGNYLSTLNYETSCRTLTISSVAGTASDKTDTRNKTSQRPKTCLKESAVPVHCSFWLAENYLFIILNTHVCLTNVILPLETMPAA